MPKKKDPSDSSIEGWASIIQADGERSRALEEARRVSAQEVRDRLCTLEPLERIRALLVANEEGEIRVNELLEDLRNAAGLQPLG